MSASADLPRANLRLARLFGEVRRAIRLTEHRSCHYFSNGPENLAARECWATPERRLAGLLDTVQANGGVIDLSQRKLARRIGASRSTLQRAMHELAAAGAVMMETSRAGTRLALAQR